MSDPILFLNQVSGPLFRQLAEDIAENLGGAVLLTDATMLPEGYQHSRLRIVAGPRYDRASGGRRVLSWLRYFFRAAVLVLASHRQSRLLIVSNPPFLAWIGWLARRIRGQGYVVLIYDVYPGLLENLGRLRKNGWMARLWRWSNRLTWGEAELVITIGPHMAATIAGMLPSTAAARIRVIPNWADGSVIYPRPHAENWFAHEHQLEGKLCVQYSGNLGATHDLGSLLAAAGRMAAAEDVLFMIIGGGERWPAVQREVATRGLANVKLLPWQPEAVLPFSLAAADVAVVTLEAGVEGHSVPSKTYYALAAGAALLVISQGENELVDLVRDFGCGLAVPAGDADAVVAALRRFHTEPGFLASCKAAARAAQERYFSRRNTDAYLTAFGLHADKP